MNAKTIVKKNSHGTANGIAIQKHLGKIYEDLISEMFGAKEELMKSQNQIMPCMSCESLDTYLIWSHNYSGYRGVCDACEVNWPES